jgi:hypothetical protein
MLPPDERFFPVLERYAAGQVSAYDAACEIQDLKIPGYHDPSASEVVLWARMAGFGIPTPTEEEAFKIRSQTFLSGKILHDRAPDTAGV